MAKVHDRHKTRPTPGATPSRAIAMREMDLTPEEARELAERIEHPTALPKLPPRDLPPGDASKLH